MKILRKIFTRSNILAGLIIFATLALLAASAYFKVMPLAAAVAEDGTALKDLYAPYDFYDRAGTEALAEKAARETDPVLIKRHDTTFSAFEDLALFFDDTDGFRLEIAGYQGGDHNVYLDNKISAYIIMCGKNNIRVKYETSRKILSSISNSEYANFKSVITQNFSSIQNRDVFDENRATLLEKFMENTKYSIIDKDLNELGNGIAGAFLKTNSIINVEETALARDAARKDALANKQIFIKEGSLIIAKGEKADQDTLRIIHSMDLSGEKDINIKLILGISGLLFIMLIPVFIFKALFSNKKKYTKRHILVVGVLEILLFSFVFLVPNSFRLFIPVFFLPMLIAILVDENMAIIVGAVTAVFLGFIYKADSTYLAILIGSGTLSAYFAKKTSVRMHLLASGLAIGVSAATILFLSTLAANGSIADITYDLAALMASGMVSVILVLGLLPLFESVFNIVTPFKLMELANPARPLLKRLLIEAPGTYHHSLMVGNLAEEAANEIGANGLLARVGAYYHDIGKMSKPMFYKENQGSEENPHNNMKPELSKLVITNHTKEGDEVARKYKLPHAIRDFIMEHHGTTQVRYFYNKALEQNGGEADADAFRYEGPRPRTKESAVVMLADSVEATIRSRGDIPRDEVEGIIRKLIREKLDDGQFDLCDIRLKDFDDIANAFMRVFGGYFHKRIEYPEPVEDVTNGIEG
ncbi:MAG: HDIG domain-containing protein [Clostridia bacterium]